MGIWLEQVSWPQVEACLENGDIAVLPVGAASKQHGYHLPMNSDAAQVWWLLNEVIDDYPLVAWPNVTYGYYPAFTDYPGSISLREHTFITLMTDIMGGILKAGARHLVILNAGVSTIEPLQAVTGTNMFKDWVSVFNIYEGGNFKICQQQLEEQKSGSHADEIETSIMLAMQPKGVEITEAEGSGDVVFERGALNRRYPNKKNYSPSGVMGDPLLATYDKGVRLTNAMLQDFRSHLESILLNRRSATG